MSENRRILGNSLILYIKLIIVSIFGLLSSRFILQALGASDFGLYSVVGGIVFLMAFLNNVMVSTTYRFIAYELGIGDSNGVNKVFNISLLIHFLLAILVILLAETLGVYYIHNYLNVASSRIPDVMFVFRFSMLSTILSILSVPYQGIITAKERFSVSAIIEIFRSGLALVAILLVLVYKGNRLRLYAALIAFVSIISSTLYILYSYNRFSPLIKWSFQKDKYKYKEMISFSGWIMFGAAASASEVQGSILILNKFFGTLINASFGIANQVNNFIKMFAQGLNQAIIPQITKSYSGGNTKRTFELVIFSSKFSFFLILLPSLPFFLKSDFILQLWLKDVPEYTSIFIKIMIVNALISTMNAGIPAAIHATGRIKYFSIILSSLSLLGLPTTIILFRLGFPPFTILLIYTAVSLIHFFVVQILLKRLMQFNIREFFFKAHFRMILVTLSLTPIYLLRNVMETNILSLIGLIILSFLWCLAAIFFLGLEKNEKNIFYNYFRKLTLPF